MDARFTISIACREDARSIQRLLEQLAADTGRPGAIRGDVEDIIHHGFGDYPLFTAFLAATKGEDVAMLLCFPEYSSWRGRPGIYVQDLYVAAAYRGSGIARALLAEATRQAEMLGGSYLRLSVAGDNDAARDFYARMGFAECAGECILTLEGSAFTALRED